MNLLLNRMSEYVMSKKIFFLILISFAGIVIAEPDFNTYFLPMTMRLDYYHTGTKETEQYSFDEIYQEPVWAGPLDRIIDDTNLGEHLFEIFDFKSGTIIYSRGFCSIFGEWQTTDEAKKVSRTISESIRFPWPKDSIKVTISSRDPNNEFKKCWSVVLDPADKNIERCKTYPNLKSTALLISGDIEKKIDVVILPDGYTQKEMKKFHKDAQRMLSTLFKVEPFKSNKTRFNVRTVDLLSNEKGIDDPQKSVFMDNVLSCSFNTFGSDRYVLTYNNKTVRKAAARVPYEHVCILVNTSKYGGGGIFNLYTTCASDNSWSDYIFVHEFGHSFGGLGDEYYTSDVAYNEFYPAGLEPWEPNITRGTTTDQIKWKDMLAPDTPVPTSWNKTEFDTHQNEYLEIRKYLKNNLFRADSLTKANDLWVHDFLRNQPYLGKVGVFEGSGYASSGLYRPFLDCRMFTRSRTGFDPVCSRAIQKMIDLYSE
jgi:hypothetical protein